MLITKSTTLEELKEAVHDCSCRACSSGCNFGSGAFADGQLPKVARFLGVSETGLKEKYLEEIKKFNTKKFRPKIERKDGRPYGKCIFYRNERCAVHDVKPLECRLAMGCKPYGEELSLWFMLNHFVNEQDQVSIERFKSYLEAGGRTLKGAEKGDF